MSDLTDPFADPELDALVDRVENDPDSVAPDAYRIEDRNRADRVMRKLRRLDARAAEADALHQARIEELDEWRDDERRRDARKRLFLEAGLAQFHALVLAEDPTVKTINLPSGDCTSNAGQPTWTYSDPAAFLAWALAGQREDVLRRKPAPAPEIDKAAVRKAFAGQVKDDGRAIDGNGEIVPGLVVLPAVRTFTAKPRQETT